MLLNRVLLLDRIVMTATSSPGPTTILYHALTAKRALKTIAVLMGFAPARLSRASRARSATMTFAA